MELLSTCPNRCFLSASNKLDPSEKASLRGPFKCLPHEHDTNITTALKKSPFLSFSSLVGPHTEATCDSGERKLCSQTWVYLPVLGLLHVLRQSRDSHA